MPNVKTAISVPRELFEEIERYSKRHRLSRSAVFTQGALRLLTSEQSRRITQKLDRVHRARKSDREARAWEKVAMQSMAKLLKDDRW